MPTIITGRCLVMTVALQRDEATTAAVEPAQAYPSCSTVRNVWSLHWYIGMQRSISRIKSSLRHEVTIPNPVFRCSEFGGVTDWYQSHLVIEN
ncbi:hypothetical protein Tco_1304378 [Tanacetum coccineum]